MTQERDPLGKRALFSGAPTVRAPEQRAPEQRRAEQRKAGPLDVVVHCSSCDRRTTLSASEFLLQHFPLWAWLPWRKHSRLMRCPACGQFAWHAVKRA